MSLAKDLIAESKTELDVLLNELAHGAATEEIKLLAEELALLSVETMVEKMNGVDTEVAEGALVAAALNLASATSTLTAKKVLEFAETVFRRVATGVISAAIAAL